ncbi:hypothetical protein [Mucilaginibacter gotjawali]|uniref:Uncharacterized protein n=2 Tax=Mucilaginibacter gotjawali TaxID=1550579 RepID=A0A839SK15_9SPHI|nr:hypothetical protein [Mucilaginibacter gotjawali]MBB3056827.1 hypothetical protein [Mucilaginibacter gotjawali]BAU55907.1 hypothetical protein MgSA37_04099 [Mucilaginibacter gotjawali]
MNRQELTKKLTELGVSQSAYSLDGPYVEGIMLEITDNYRPGDIAYKEWRVFEHERGAPI